MTSPSDRTGVEAGMAVTETEPAVGAMCLINVGGKERPWWAPAERMSVDIFDFNSGECRIKLGMRWSYFPGQSPLERVLALDNGRFFNMGKTMGETAFKVVVLIGRGSDARPTQFTGATPNEAAAAALRALAGEGE